MYLAAYNSKDTKRDTHKKISLRFAKDGFSVYVFTLESCSKAMLRFGMLLHFLCSEDFLLYSVIFTYIYSAGLISKKHLNIYVN